jgi:hypothetical protein
MYQHTNPTRSRRNAQGHKNFLKPHHSIPPISLLTLLLILRVQTRHALPRNTARDPTLEQPTDSPPANPTETLKRLPSGLGRLQTVDREPFWAGVRALAVAQVRPARDDNRVLELEALSFGVLAHLDLDQVLRRALRTTARRSASVAAGDDEVGVGGFAGDFGRAADLVLVWVRGFGDVRESALADLCEDAIAPVCADGEEGCELFAVVEEVAFGGDGQLGRCEGC